MKIQSLFIVSLFSIFCTVAYAEQATGLCKDGTEFTGVSKRGACRGHKGLQAWYADKQTAPATTEAPTPAAAVSAPSAPTAAPGASISGTATGLCKDGSLYTGSSKRGACRGHKGLQEWYADKQTAPATTAAPTPAASAPTAAPGASISGTATGLCKDGSLYKGSSKRGACRGHKGLQEWYADKQTSAPAAAPAPIAAPTAAPAASVNEAATGLCKDGTPYTGTSKRGACRGHKGLQEWYADKQTAAVPATTTPAQGSTAPAPNAAAQPTPAATPAQTATAAAVPATGGAPGQVWVNTKSKIYHCQGSKYYGKTNEGEYMTEAQAQAQGFNPNRKKTCGINK